MGRDTLIQKQGRSKQIAKRTRSLEALCSLDLHEKSHGGNRRVAEQGEEKNFVAC
jgi:hypothetical protein